jgi:hydroxymethylglutaryl-CoA lyase
MALPDEVKIREVAPRDGFQSLKIFLPTEKKLFIINAILDAQVREIEATSFVSPSAIRQFKDAAELVAKLPRQSITYAALVPNLRGARDAIKAHIDRLVVVISATEAHNQENVRRSVNESIADLDAIFELARAHNTPVTGAVSVSFGCPYQGDVPQKDVYSLVKAYISRGANSIILADTTGMATPHRVEKMVAQFQDTFPDTNLILHFHNNRGTAMANLLAAVKVGANSFDTSLGGIGGCPYVPQAAGNLPTEDVVYMLEDMGIRTGINLESIIKAAQLLEKTLGYTLPGQVMKSGPRDPVLAAKVRNIV